MNYFNRRLISSICVTEKNALRINILDKKRKHKVAAAAQNIYKANQAHEQEKNILAAIVADTNPPAERKSIRFAQDQDDVAKEQEGVVPHTGLPRTFISSKKHLSTSPEDLSERWGFSLAQAALTLKTTTQRLIRLALMPLDRRYKSDTMAARCKLIHQDKYLQVFSIKDFSVEAYKIKRNKDSHKGLDNFVKEYGAPDKMI